MLIYYVSCLREQLNRYIYHIVSVGFEVLQSFFRGSAYDAVHDIPPNIWSQEFVLIFGYQLASFKLKISWNFAFFLLRPLGWNFWILAEKSLKKCWKLAEIVLAESIAPCWAFATMLKSCCKHVLILCCNCLICASTGCEFSSGLKFSFSAIYWLHAVFLLRCLNLASASSNFGVLLNFSCDAEIWLQCWYFASIS